MSAASDSPAPGTVHPATGATLEAVSWHAAGEVPGIVARARVAQARWADTPLDRRVERVLALSRHIAERRHEALRLLDRETGRAAADSLLSEIAILPGYAKGVVKIARRALARETVRLSPLEFPGKKAVIEAVPRGVVAIIEPWNYPLLQFYKPLLPALLSGNAVVLKPSEHSAATGRWLLEQCAAVLPEGVVTGVLGGAEVGAALLEDDIDAVVFCGSVATGRKVAARCAERLIPCSTELGGKDAAIVLADCDLQRTLAGLAYGALHNAGQDCSAIERLYVEETIADTLVERLAEAAGRLSVERDLGPLQNPAQLRVVEMHVADALDKGARLVTGGKRCGPGYGFEPTILDRCTPEMLVVSEETFGPVLAVIRIASGEEGVRLANQSHFGLQGSVWTRNLERGERLARRLEVGVALVNNHVFAGVVPGIPWTGTKHTGTGVAASGHAYPTFVRRRTIIVDKNKNPEPFWFPGDGDLLEMGHALTEFNLGALGRVFKLLGLLSRRTRTVRQFFAR